MFYDIINIIKSYKEKVDDKENVRYVKDNFRK